MSLKRTLNTTLKDILFRIKELDTNSCLALKQEYKEWIEALEVGDDHPYVLYLDNLDLKNKNTH